MNTLQFFVLKKVYSSFSSLETNTDNQTEEESGVGEKFDASIIAKEVKGVNVALLALASTVNDAMGLYKVISYRNCS